MARRYRHLLSLTFAAGGLFATQHLLADTMQYQYRYDTAGRLIEARSTDTVIGYQYDAAGTITQRQTAPNLVLFADGFEEAP